MTIICGEHGSAMCHEVTNSKNNLKLLSRLFRCLLHTSRHWQGATRDATRVKAVDWSKRDESSEKGEGACPLWTQ